MFRSRKGRPRAFALQLLMGMLIVALVPLLLLSTLAGQTVRSQLTEMNARSAAITEQNYIRMYETNIEQQAKAINAELRKVEDAVLMAKAMAESIFRSDHQPVVQPLSFVYDSQRKGFVEPSDKADPRLGTVGIRDESGRKRPTAVQAYDLSLAKSLYPVFRSATSRNPTIVAMYYIHPLDGSFFYPEYDGPEAPVQPRIKPLTSYPFYTAALNVPPSEERVIWTEPYYDITPRGWMFTATAPVYDERRVLKGVVAADVTIERFVGNVLDTSFHGGDGYALLLDQQSGLIAAQKHGGEELATLDLATLFAPQYDNSFRSMRLGGKPQAVFSRTIPATSWVLGYIVPEQKMLEPVYSATSAVAETTKKKLFFQLAGLGGLASCICILLAFYLRAKIVRPVQSLTNAFTEVGGGMFPQKLHDTGSLEFNRLLHAFNRMTDQIRELMEQQVQHNQQLEHKVELRTEELSAMNRELELRVDELLRIENWRKELFMNISHDLKTPITLIRGYIEAIQDGTIPPQSTSVFLERIYEGIQTITRFVKHLTELSLLETRQTKAVMAELDAERFFLQLAEKWKAYLTLENRPFHIQRSGGSAWLSGDADMIERVIGNLLENAIKYSDASAPITLRYEQDGGVVRYHVTDNGNGIPEKEMPLIFQSFYRVDRSRNSHIPGSGLGLSIAKEIADIHGGELTVKRNPSGVGCTFTLVLPIAEAPSSRQRLAQ
ncbi:signal transduction histidine kinase [Paenibacillus phyllosphaerae]|uniref:histidine kinase n=1 Tax=Paenibacillus phyllosphaerae TaxID=274593 RepID=A0A7W5B4S0_9BACL|nr:sensor histidine kinase [Paenibacillus phyllosphaerae]MBB3114353.1 signal transduction histidine kinase [Paenibacillus phyllosphaerae]